MARTRNERIIELTEKMFVRAVSWHIAHDHDWHSEVFHSCFMAASECVEKSEALASKALDENKES